MHFLVHGEIGQLCNPFFIEILSGSNDNLPDSGDFLTSERPTELSAPRPAPLLRRFVVGVMAGVMALRLAAIAWSGLMRQWSPGRDGRRRHARGRTSWRPWHTKRRRSTLSRGSSGLAVGVEVACLVVACASTVINMVNNIVCSV
ncbi:hypothetical protein HK405_003761 [Cladochytrium tenue]|nr:hypothetical protein HK405_003761 [Cladochytrium tenue]